MPENDRFRLKNLKTYRRGTVTIPVLEDITFDICEEESRPHGPPVPVKARS
jgi:hypothetical protein